MNTHARKTATFFLQQQGPQLCARTEGMPVNCPSFIATCSLFRFNNLRHGEVVLYRVSWGATTFPPQLVAPVVLPALDLERFAGRIRDLVAGRGYHHHRHFLVNIDSRYSVGHRFPSERVLDILASIHSLTVAALKRAGNESGPRPSGSVLTVRTERCLSAREPRLRLVWQSLSVRRRSGA